MFLSEEWKSLLRDLGLLILRLGAGGMMLYGHGWGKFMSFADKAASFPDPLGVGATTSMALTIFAEFLCSILVVLGLGTRFAAFTLLFTMLVAALVVHGGDPFGKKEMALLYGTTFVTLLGTGGGRISLDALIEFLLEDR